MGPRVSKSDHNSEKSIKVPVTAALTLLSHSVNTPGSYNIFYTAKIPKVNPWTPVLDTDVDASQILY